MRPVVRGVVLWLIAALLLPACGGGGARKGSRYKRPYNKAKKLFEAGRDAKDTGDLMTAGDKLRGAETAVERLLDKVPRRSSYYEKATKLLDKIQDARNELAQAEKARKQKIKGRLVAHSSGDGGSSRESPRVSLTTSKSPTPIDPAVARRLARQRERELEVAADEDDPAEEEIFKKKRRDAALKKRGEAEERPEGAQDDEPNKKAENESGSDDPNLPPGFDPKNIKPTTPNVVIGRSEKKGKFWIVYFWFVNKKEVTRVGKAEAQVRDENHKLKARSAAFYRADDFKPNWKDIYESQGQQLWADAVQIQQNQAINLVCIGEHDKPREIKKVSVEVYTADGQEYYSQVEDF